VSLFDGVLGGIVNRVLNAEGGETSQLMQTALGLLQEHGGVSGLVEKFSHAGLADEAASWVSSGANLPVSADQIQQVLGSDAVASLAGKLGISSDQLNAGLAQVLPGVIDRLTPNGQIPDEQHSLIGEALAMFKS
jgi:uncharacterized protein YidB (DUF937 family)